MLFLLNGVVVLFLIGISVNAHLLAQSHIPAKRLRPLHGETGSSSKHKDKPTVVLGGQLVHLNTSQLQPHRF